MHDIDEQRTHIIMKLRSQHKCTESHGRNYITKCSQLFIAQMHKYDQLTKKQYHAL